MEESIVGKEENAGNKHSSLLQIRIQQSLYDVSNCLPQFDSGQHEICTNLKRCRTLSWQQNRKAQNEKKNIQKQFYKTVKPQWLLAQGIGIIHTSYPYKYRL